MGPSVPTVKRLFAVSGNECAFPKCKTPLVDAPSGKVTGRICHIKASAVNGPRYDPSQSEEERHEFSNLVLMCPIHHDVIDDDPDSYTVERLKAIKQEHEKSHAVDSEPEERIANELIVNITGNSITHGSVIVSQNQMGGQIAHSITNIGPQPRSIPPTARRSLVTDLKNHPPERIDITTLMNDAEALQLTDSLLPLLNEAGWQIGSDELGTVTSVVRGIVIETRASRPGLDALRRWLLSIGLAAEIRVNRSFPRDRIFVGANL